MRVSRIGSVESSAACVNFRLARSAESANECCCNAVKDFQGSPSKTSSMRGISASVYW